MPQRSADRRRDLLLDDALDLARLPETVLGDDGAGFRSAARLRLAAQHDILRTEAAGADVHVFHTFDADAQ